jgi:maleylpyruvate isomerase
VTPQELSERLAAVSSAERRLSVTAADLDDLGTASLCAGWTRGHVLAHVALNAHSLVNLMEWARTGEKTPQYPSWEERDSDIERCSKRSRDEHLTALAEASAAFAAAAGRVPPDRWSFEVHGIAGEPQPVARFLFGRLREVEIHHVDLAAGYGAKDWDEAFVRAVLEEVPGRLGGSASEPFVAEATDLGMTVRIGDADTGRAVRGPGRALLAWLLGRDDGAGLDHGGRGLPPVPPWG